VDKPTIEERAILREVMVDPLARRLLKNKQRWEQMGALAVLREWGDPRKWSSYVEELGRNE